MRGPWKLSAVALPLAMLALFLVSLPSRAETADDEHVIYFYGSTEYESVPDSGTGAHTILINHTPANCEEVAMQAKLVQDKSSTWLDRRAAGLRRIEAKDLVFFQYKGLGFRLPYVEREEGATFYYDPFELLGYLFVRFHALGCAKRKLTYSPEWPFGIVPIPDDDARISPIGRRKGRFTYVESFRGFPTDVYYCRKALSDADIAVLSRRLREVKAQRRIEDSAPFRDYTATRENLCGEAAP